MNDSIDENNWIERLECPPSILTSSIKKKLNTGISGIVWNEIFNLVRSAKEAKEIQRNVLLYKLQNEIEDPVLNNVQRLDELKVEDEKLNDRIKAAEKAHEKQEHLIRTKIHRLNEIKSAQETLCIKKEFLKMKRNLLITDTENCTKMREVCRLLMPPVSNYSIEEVESKLEECLAIVQSFSTGGDRKQVWASIQESLSPFQIKDIWNIILRNRTSCTEKLIQLFMKKDLTLEDAEEENKMNLTTDSVGESTAEELGLGVAKVSAQIVNLVSERFLSQTKYDNCQETMMTYIDEIEKAQEHIGDFSEWFVSKLEVHKLELLRTTLQKHLEQNKLDDEQVHSSEMGHILKTIESLDLDIENHVQQVQNSLRVLKTTLPLINEEKENLVSSLQKIVNLKNEDWNYNFLNIDLANELNVYQDNFNIECLRKVVIQSSYKYVDCIFNGKTLSSIPAKTLNDRVSLFPSIYTPVHQLIECYAQIEFSHRLEALKKINAETETYVNEEESLDPINAVSHYDLETFEQLHEIDSTCAKANNDIRNFNLILEAWKSQSVSKKVLSIFNNIVVNGTTYKEWFQRYQMLVYMIQQNLN